MPITLTSDPQLQLAVSRGSRHDLRCRRARVLGGGPKGQGHLAASEGPGAGGPRGQWCPSQDTELQALLTLSLLLGALRICSGFPVHKIDNHEHVL